MLPIPSACVALYLFVLSCSTQMLNEAQIYCKKQSMLQINYLGSMKTEGLSDCWLAAVCELCLPSAFFMTMESTVMLIYQLPTSFQEQPALHSCGYISTAQTSFSGAGLTHSAEDEFSPSD